MFMTWRVPRGASKNGGKKISDADLDRAIRNQFQSTYGKRYEFLSAVSQSESEYGEFKIHFSFAGMPQGFNPNPAFKTKDASLIKTKNTEIRENFDNERSIGGIEEPIRGKSMRHDSFIMTH